MGVPGQAARRPGGQGELTRIRISESADPSPDFFEKNRPTPPRIFLGRFRPPDLARIEQSHGCRTFARSGLRVAVDRSFRSSCRLAGRVRRPPRPDLAKRRSQGLAMP